MIKRSCSEWESPVNGFPGPKFRGGGRPLVNLHQMKFNERHFLPSNESEKHGAAEIRTPLFWFQILVSRFFRPKIFKPKIDFENKYAFRWRRVKKYKDSEDKTDWKQILFQSEQRVLITRLIPDFRWLWVKANFAAVPKEDTKSHRQNAKLARNHLERISFFFVSFFLLGMIRVSDFSSTKIYKALKEV